MKEWLVNKNNANLDLMSKVLNIDKDLANFLANRNIRSKNMAIKFLNPALKFLGDIKIMKDIDKALEMINDALEHNKKIIIYGDYDVDGVMSTVILFKTLFFLGANINFYLPSRFEDGFGLNLNAIKKIYDDGAELIITCDNGIAALEEIDCAKKLGMKIIIIDHHFPNKNIDSTDINNYDKDILPNADAIIDNKQQDCNYEFKELCAAGMAYKISMLLLKIYKTDLEKKNKISLDDLENDLLVFAAIGTLCDVVKLIDENRIIAKNGLDLINNNKLKNKGLIALLELNKIYGRRINSDDIGFIIGPCINACGRLKSAELAANLFLCDNKSDYEIKNLAQEIYDLNAKRKIITRDACKEIFFELENYDLIANPVIVYYNKNIEESVAGIIAGRIKEKYSHPAIFFTDSQEENIIKGSGRSIENYNMFEELSKCKDLFLKFGGHKMAAGLSMEKKNLELLRQKLNLNSNLLESDFIEKINIDAELEIDNIDYFLFDKINLLAPFGHENHEPLFISNDVRIEKINAIESKNTIIFSLKQNEKFIKAISFGMYDYFKEQLEIYFDNYDCVKILNGFIDNNIDLLLDLVYNIEANEFNNKTSLQLKIKDFRLKLN